MRWENLSVVPDDSQQHNAARAAPPLPLALPNAVARTFDTPGFAGMTFYEVRAKSIINRVPSASRVPFEWTINPYRGCSHACVYCLSGETPILMADGRTKCLAELRVGDRVYGTARVGKYRRYVVTQVLDHWSTVRPAFRVTLANGTKLIASGDHRFLTERGWKHVWKLPPGPEQRAYLTTSNKLMGTGRFAGAPKDTTDYRLGYLCGAIRGAGHPVGGARFRLGFSDREALGRVRSYLSDFGIATADIGPTGTATAEPARDATEFAAGPAEVNAEGASGGPRGSSPRPRRSQVIQASGRETVAAITELIRWPPAATVDWRKGFLAGMFDSRGSRSENTLRISNSDDVVLRRTMAALRRLKFDHVLEDNQLPNGIRTIRVRGGLGEHLRFRHLTDPAITRKWNLVGTAIKSDADLRVASVKPLGLELPLYDIATGTGDFIANGTVSHNCFARNTHTYLDLDAGRDFGSKVIVKVNAGEVLRKELSAAKWQGAHIAMGTNVDCYQRAEGKYRLMRQIIAALRDFANPFSILTKGTLILRDLDLLRQAAEMTQVGLAMSVGFVDEAMWRAVEPGTPSPRRRLDAVRALVDAGFSVGVLMAPILPGLTDSDESIEATVAAIAAAGASNVTPLPLHLRKGAREWYSAWLARSFPDLVPRYRELYRRGAYLPQAYQREITARVRVAARRHGLERAAPGETRQLPGSSDRSRSPTVRAGRPPATTESEQLTLL